jgi:hypothetical protein
MEKLDEILTLTELRGIRIEISGLREEVGNFPGSFELSEEETKEIERDIEAYQKGELETVNVDEAKRNLKL